MTTAPGPVFAWHHPPVEGTREAAVILCRPFGYEAQCTQRAYRHLAERLSAAGFHVLRVDYHGTGDSSGGDADDDRLAAWAGSVRAAMQWARSSLDAEKVALFGARFGALVALQAATDGGVDALALLAPPASGRAWLRETRALQSMMVAAITGLQRRDAALGGEESAGFLLTDSTLAAIEQLDRGASAPGIRTALLVARDDLPGPEEKLAARLRAQGTDVTLSRAAGYGAMMHPDPRLSVVPDDAWAEVTGWLTARYRIVPEPLVDRPDAARDAARRAKGAANGASPSSYPAVATVRENHAAPYVREEAVDMGGLFGIVTEPAQPVARELPSIVLHNIGANSHIGANRIYVTMARRWAALGFRVLRFDIAGLGESPSDDRAGENQVYANGSPEGSRRAMDFLARARDARRFVLMGLCSGAYFSFHSALADERVAGIALINVQRFHWKKGDAVDTRKQDVLKSSQYYWREASGIDAWLRLARGEVAVRAIAQGVLQEGWEFVRHRLVHALLGESPVSRSFRSLLRRGTDVMIVLSADDSARNLVEGHLGTNAWPFQRERGFRLEIVDGADHTFSPLACQDTLLSLLTSHLRARFRPELAPSESKPPPAVATTASALR